MVVNRRSLLKLGLYTVAAKNIGLSPQVITPEMFGAQGDGAANDGVAFDKLINHINSLDGPGGVTVVCEGSYLLEGTKAQRYAPLGAEDKGGVVLGLPPIIRAEVHFKCEGAKFLVPSSMPWRRTFKGGDSKDVFFNGFEFKGDGATIAGGEFLGNLAQRQAQRGPSTSGFGGREFGLVMSGRNWTIDGIVSSEWGTDCVLITNSGVIRNSALQGGRRNNISVVPMVRGDTCIDVTIENCYIAEGGNWPENIRNRPGGGVVVEAGRVDAKACVSIQKCRFEGNYLKDLQISKGALNCKVTGNTFTNVVKIQPKNLGGHFIGDNDFLEDSHISTIYGGEKNPPITVQNNRFETTKYKHYYVRKIPRGVQKGEKPKIISSGNARTVYPE